MLGHAAHLSSTVRDYAQEVGAILLLEKVEEFSRENAFVLDEMIEWDALDD